jgi:hypothetical protein
MHNEATILSPEKEGFPVQSEKTNELIKIALELVAKT